MAKNRLHDMQTDNVIVALGANFPGAWGSPIDSLRCSIVRMKALGLISRRVSKLYCTRPYGLVRQGRYLNAVVAVTCRLPPTRLLAALKAIEREAGRRMGVRNGPRPLDLDLIAYGGRRLGWTGKRGAARPRLVLPHPEMHKRPFVLRPLMDVAPHWRHPVLGKTPRQMLSRLRQTPHEVEPVLDSHWVTCEKNIR